MKQIIYFTAEWCGPCKMIRPMIQELIGERLEISIVDIDQNQQLAMQYKIQSVPTFIFMKDGVEVSRKVGANISKESIKQYFQ